MHLLSCRWLLFFSILFPFLSFFLSPRQTRALDVVSDVSCYRSITELFVRGKRHSSGNTRSAWHRCNGQPWSALFAPSISLKDSRPSRLFSYYAVPCNDSTGADVNLVLRHLFPPSPRPPLSRWVFPSSSLLWLFQILGISSSRPKQRRNDRKRQRGRGKRKERKKPAVVIGDDDILMVLEVGSVVETITMRRQTVGEADRRDSETTRRDGPVW